ncbi:Heterokaryon incompatibility protein (HET) domain containing protein [Naviculisporaceae sp. PSN 640]
MGSPIAKHPTPVQFALKVFNDDWARYGDGPMWPVLDFNGDYEDDEAVGRATLQAKTDPTSYGLSKLLSTDADELTNGSLEFWLSLVFADYIGNSVVLPLEIETDKEAEAIAQINLEHQGSTGTPENMRLAKHWLRSCLHTHPRCRSSTDVRSTEWLPTRLVFVGSAVSSQLHLVTTAKCDPKELEVTYAALSYRWGDQSQFCLMSAKVQQYHESIAFHELSKTLQEAIHTCRSIGLEYLWVDALCIVQDDMRDWAQESALMSKVYGFATCTIAAANSGEDQGGCFATRNQYQVRPCPFPNPLNPLTSKHRFYIRPQFLKDIFEQEVRQSAWYTRGWVFQERMLSSRLLIFGKTQMLWACQEIQAAESWPSGKTSENFIDQFDSFEVDKARLEKLLDPSQHVTAMNDLWAVLLRDYAASTNNFTRTSDKLMALQGLASKIQASTGRRYCAGLWVDESLPASLLWTALGPSVKRPTDIRAPSWSWASLDCGIEFNTGRFKGIAVVGGIQVLDDEKTLTANYFDVMPQRLQASGRMYRVSITGGSGLAVYKQRLPWLKEPPLGAKRTFEKCHSIISGAWHWLFNKILKPLGYGLLFLLFFPASLLLVGLLLALLPIIPLLVLIYLAVEACFGTFPDIETGMMIPGADHSKGSDLRATCFFDCATTPSGTGDEQRIFIIPILDGYRTSGLIVQLVQSPGVPGQGQGGYRYYKRLGVFEMNSFELRKFRMEGGDNNGSSLAEQSFYLI